VAEIYQPRINTQSLKVAILTQKILASRGIETDIAVSFHRLIVLDHDNKMHDVRLLERFILFLRTIAKSFNGDFAVYLTPNGAHGVVLKRVDRDTWKRFYAVLLDTLHDNEKLQRIIDRYHVYMSLKRGYVTLRLNQICRYVICTLTTRGYHCERDMYCLQRAWKHG
jgi:hypothetical protein